jgi:hypothetical protein
MGNGEFPRPWENNRSYSESYCLRTRPKEATPARPKEKRLPTVLDRWHARATRRDLILATAALADEEREFVHAFLADPENPYAGRGEMSVPWPSNVETTAFAKLNTFLAPALDRPRIRRTKLVALMSPEPRTPPLGAQWQWRFASELDLQKAEINYRWAPVCECVRYRDDERGSRRPRNLLTVMRAGLGEYPYVEELLSQDGLFRTFRQNAEIDRLRREIDTIRKERGLEPLYDRG